MSLRVIEAEAVFSLLGAASDTACQGDGSPLTEKPRQVWGEKLPAPGGHLRSKSMWWMDILKTCRIC